MTLTKEERRKLEEEELNETLEIRKKLLQEQKIREEETAIYNFILIRFILVTPFKGFSRNTKR